MTDTLPRTLDCALWLAARGLAVFPVDHPSLPRCAGAHRPGQPCDGKRGKHPCGKWSRDATTDPDTIRRLFGNAPRNIGAACGPSGLLVVDEDEPGALDRYAATIAATIEPTFTVLTSRGAHRYYWQPAGQQLGNSPGALAAFHCDMRGRGGFVVAPGSLHETGHLYRPADPAAPIIPAPAWLVSALRPTPAPTTAREQGARKTERHPVTALTALVQFVLDATEGNRNQRLFWAACRAFEHANSGAFTPAQAAGALLDAATSPSVGLVEGDARATITSAYRTTGTRTTR